MITAALILRCSVEMALSHSLIGKTLPHFCQAAPFPNPPPPPPFLTAPKGLARFRDPRWKSNSINQIMARRTVGIPTSRLHANEAGGVCGEGGRRRGRCVGREDRPRSFLGGDEKAGRGRGADLFKPFPTGSACASRTASHFKMLSVLFVNLSHLNRLCSFSLTLLPSRRLGEDQVFPHLLVLDGSVSTTLCLSLLESPL